MFTSPINRTALRTAVACICSFAVSSALADEEKKLPSPVNEVLITKDQAQVSITYFGSDVGKNAAVLILLCDDKIGRVFWEKAGIAARLQKHGYAVVTVDFRGFGSNKAESGKEPTMNKTLAGLIAKFDLDAVKAFILKEHEAGKLNLRKMGIVAPGYTASLATAWAAYDWSKAPYDDAPTLADRTPRGQDPQAICFLSPTDATGMPGTNYTRALKTTYGLAFQLAVGTENRSAFRSATRYANVIGVNKRDKEPNPRVDYREFKSKAQGLGLLLLRGSKLELMITAFFDENIKKLQIPHISRKSRLLD